MTVEVLAIIIAAASLFVTLGGGLFAGFAWMLRRMDERFDKVYKEFDKVREEMSELRTNLTEVKISVARLEGPSPRLIWPKQ